MPALMDHVADVANGGTELYRLAQLYPLPDFVKTADQSLHLQVPQGVAPTIYADPVNKQFPCHTNVSTWLSHLFYQEKRAEFHPKNQAQIEKRLAQYANYFKIKAACDAITQRWQELHKTAEDTLPDSAFAYVWVGENNEKQRHLVMRNPMEVKVAAEYVSQYHDRFSFPQRHGMAKRILEKAANLGASLGQHTQYLERQAGRGVCDPAEVVEAIEKRAMCIHADTGATRDGSGNLTGGLRASFKKMAQCIKESPAQALQPDMLVKLAETLDQLDRQWKLDELYGKALTRPEDVIFKNTFSKTAEDLTKHVATTSGKTYEKSAFRKLALSEVRSLFGEDFAEQVKTPLGVIDPEKMASLVPTLPRPDAQLLDGLLSDNGIVPVLHKSAAARQGMTPEVINAIAASYGLR